MREKTKRLVREYVESLLIAGVLALLIRTFIITPFKIPTGSMEPTLMPGDKIFVSRFIYRFRKPQRGDIIVFRYPEDLRRDFIKRLVAFGGETVEITDGKIKIDGELVDGSTVILPAPFPVFSPGDTEGAGAAGDALSAIEAGQAPTLGQGAARGPRARGRLHAARSLPRRDRRVAVGAGRLPTPGGWNRCAAPARSPAPVVARRPALGGGRGHLWPVRCLGAAHRSHRAARLDSSRARQSGGGGEADGGAARRAASDTARGCGRAPR